MNKLFKIIIFSYLPFICLFIFGYANWLNNDYYFCCIILDWFCSLLSFILVLDIKSRLHCVFYINLSQCDVKYWHIDSPNDIFVLFHNQLRSIMNKIIILTINIWCPRCWVNQQCWWRNRCLFHAGSPIYTIKHQRHSQYSVDKIWNQSIK